MNKRLRVVANSIMTVRTPIEVIWFKRDLRTYDHAPLIEACKAAETNGYAILPLYIVELNLWQGTDAAYRHWHFIRDCLIELNESLTSLGQPLQVIFGHATEVLTELHKEFYINHLWSHQETGNRLSYLRDIAVLKWTQETQVGWTQIPQHPVIRGGLNRDIYFQKVQDFFAQPCLNQPLFQQSRALHLNNAVAVNKKLSNPYVHPQSQVINEQIQLGGRRRGLALLHNFLQSRHHHYLKYLAKPLGGDQYSSRLSAHLAYGSLSIKEVMQHTFQATDKSRNKNLKAFNERLFWQSHFMQKLESEYQIEFKCMHPDYEHLRPWDEAAKKRFRAWQLGQTGVPFVDACMRCLRITGWLPFRMRAMLVSFASYQLWLPWQKTAIHLARLFTDYEPGIHYSQIQMQSGVTGINAIRVYNPVKQSKEHDPQGVFIKKWCPELQSIDVACVHEPWKCYNQALNFAENRPSDIYVKPIVEPDEALKQAKDKIFAFRDQVASKQGNQAVFEKHGSRRKRSLATVSKQSRQAKKAPRVNRKEAENNQLSLF